MYPWYRDAGQLGQFNPQAMPAAIKTETGYNDCMLALDYAAQSKVSDSSSKTRLPRAPQP
jgi:hypothetical protein